MWVCKMLERSIRLFLAVTTLIVSGGCSFFAPASQSIHINGIPDDATVVINGNSVKVPATIDVPRNKNLTIIVHKNGFKTYKVTTGYSLSTIGIVDAIGCWLFLLPGVGLLSPGAWELMENNFYYTLTPEVK